MNGVLGPAPAKLSLGEIWADEMNFCINHAPGAGLITGNC